MSWVSQSELDALREQKESKIRELSDRIEWLRAHYSDELSRRDRAIEERIAAKDSEVEQWKIRTAQAKEYGVKAEKEAAGYLRELNRLRRSLEA